jgi:hypothetical protein
MNWKKLLYYVPGVGLATHAINEYKTRKGQHHWYDIREAKDRKALGMYAVETGLFAFAIAWKVYFGNGIVTGEWNPKSYFKKDYIEKIEREKTDSSKINNKIQRKNNLENKTIDYEHLLKVIG